jgi:hypothetical protein
MGIEVEVNKGKSCIPKPEDLTSVAGEKCLERFFRIGSLLISTAIILTCFGFTCFACTGVCWADWILFGKTEDAELYYDKEDITRSSSGTDNVWAKYVYTEVGVKDRVRQLGAKFENLDHSITLFEIDCVGKLALSLSTVYFSKDKSVLKIDKPDNNWVYISTGSLFDTLHGHVCK